MSENEKKKKQVPRSNKSFLQFLALMFGSITMLVIMWTIGFSIWLSAGSVKPSLDAEYIPTAEYLLENPFEEPETDWGELNIEISGIESDSEEICFTIQGSSDEDFERATYVEILINEQLASRMLTQYLTTYETLPAFRGFCVPSILNSGLHIIEARAYSDIFVEPNYIRRWAIEVE